MRSKGTFLMLLATGIVLTPVTANWADEIIPTELLKWSQLPRVDRWGYDFSSDTLVPSRVATDFLCNDPRPVDKIHWWGSYWKTTAGYASHYSDSWPDPTLIGGQSVDPGVLLGFNVEFYADVPESADPTVPMPWSHPGELLYEAFVPIEEVARTPYAIIDRNGDGILGNDGDEAIWQYYVELTKPFLQVQGEIYWLKIQAVNDNADVNPQGIQWGWHEAVDLWNDEAVQSGPSQLWGLMYQKEWVELSNKDLAFELGVIPEPATALLVALGLAGAFGAARRRRRR